MRFAVAAVMAVAVVVMEFGSVLSLHVNRKKRWSVQTTMRVPVPNPPGEDLIEVLASTPDIRYSDRMKKLTALKTSRHKACFITDLDPGFNLDNNEMTQIIRSSVPEKIDSPPAYNSFNQRAGAYITPMCQFMDVYWLSDPSPPIPLHDERTPPSLNSYHQLPQTRRPLTQPSPPSFEHDQQQPLPAQTGHPNLTPPPLSDHHQREEVPTNRDTPQTGHPILTPPPLSDHHQREEAPTNRDTPRPGHPILTPPPLSDNQHGQKVTSQRANPQSGRPMPTLPPSAGSHQLPLGTNHIVPLTRQSAQTPPPLAVWRQLQMDKLQK